VSEAALAYLDRSRQMKPTTRRHLWDWVHQFTGIRIPHAAVCAGHSAPFDFFAQQVLERPRLSLWHGPRGSGKSFLSAIDTHVSSRFNPRHGTRILGGSGAQSLQIYQALQAVLLDGHGPSGNDGDTVRRLLTTKAEYHNGSVVDILTASPTSVRGPHVPSLKLDEVDEIKPDLRESAVGVCMEQHGNRASILMTSTWHKVAGPMAELIEKGRSGAFPVHTYCMFEVLERCPEGRSGPDLEECPECPIRPWCHSDLGSHPSGLPKAKRSRGHYTIDAFIQKVESVSLRVLESDYLCLRPKASGTWFVEFEESLHVTPKAEYDPRLPVHVSVDPGVETGAVWFQVRRDAAGNIAHVNVFGDLYIYDGLAEMNALAVRKRTTELTGLDVRQCRFSMDSSSKQKTAVGVVLRGEYERADCRGRGGIEHWPVTLKTDEMAQVAALLKSADGTVRLTFHPRCRKLIVAMQSYERAQRGGQWMDAPKDPQHPHEDLVDPLAGALKLEQPQGRTPPPQLRNVSARGLV
jgi:hypothetical protein